MTSTLVATAGSASADAYCTMVEAEAYISSLYYSSDWTGKSDTQKDQVIRQATRLLDCLSWVGVKAASSQALEWPRSDVYDRNGYEVASDAIPAFLRNATAEFALRLLAEDRAADAGAIVPERVKVGSLEVEKLQRRVYPASVLDMVSAYLAGAPDSPAVMRS